MTLERWQQIKGVLAAALELQSDQRTAYVLNACSGDDTLRREVESLLAHEEKTTSFLEAATLEAAAKVFYETQGPSLMGRRVGCYQVLSLIGAGGMGEVYRVHDTKLGRDVAMKVLPSNLIHNSELLARFQREARMLAALNHPNIATIYGLEDFDSVHCLVMELVPGDTLAERIRRRGPLPIKEALKVGAQIAEALEAAHEKGVIHRDLKPANVKVTPEGRVKVLDFGLAKAFAGGVGPDLSDAATLTVVGTEEGRILGTPTYMSPEQARGKAVDKRTDIWAFGCVLYEMLTGRQPFRGETFSDTVAQILEREPEWELLPISTPAKVQDVLDRCLEKDLHRRLRDIGDARIELVDALAGAAGQGVSRRKGPRMTRRAAIGALAGAAAGAAGVATSVWYLWPRGPKPVMRLSIDVSPAQQLAGFT
jgi:serine/threonine protein kinase